MLLRLSIFFINKVAQHTWRQFRNLESSRLVQFYVVPDDKYVFDAALYPNVGP